MAGFVLCRAFRCSVMRPKQTHTHCQPHTPACTFSPAIQTYSHAFTHLLSQPHEELKIDDSITKGVGGRSRQAGERDEEWSQGRHGAHQRLEETTKYDKERRQQGENEETKTRAKESAMHCHMVVELKQLAVNLCFVTADNTPGSDKKDFNY